MSVDAQTLAAAGGAIAASGVILTGIGWFARQARHFHLRLRNFLDDWQGTDGRPGHEPTPGVMQSIAKLRAQIAAISAETMPNGGNSMRDIVHQTATDVAQLRARMELFEHQREDRDTGEPL